jgi:CO/xanthine dehydrogenase Mo-binding subunit
VIGRPVRWVAERSEGLLSDEQARGSTVDAELALMSAASTGSAALAQSSSMARRCAPV